MPINIVTAQFIAYTAFTLASVTVALVSLFLAYRQNFGWEPIVLVTSHGMSGGGDDRDFYRALLSLEIWNRRKYPIVVRGARARFNVLKFENPNKDQHVGNGWSIFRSDELLFHENIRLEPSAHYPLEISAPFRRRTLDDLNDRVKISVSYYDPRSNKYKDATTTRDYNFK